MKLLALFGLMFTALITAGQKNDYVWLGGYDSQVGFDSMQGVKYGTTLMDFNYIPRQVSYDSTAMNFDFTNTSYCDDAGNLMFYTNGIYIANSLNEVIANSDSMNAGYFQYVWNPSIQNYGYRNPYGIMAVQNIANPNQYYLVHSWIDTLDFQIYCRAIYTTLLDMSLNNGHGKVISKNQPVISDLLGEELAITRHANGRYWWAIAQKQNSNCYYRILIDSSGPHPLSGLNCGSDTVFQGDFGAACFSPDGNTYCYFAYNQGLNIFDFDRCSGELSNPRHLALPIVADSGWIGLGAAISPNSRFLYVAVTYQLYQFDLSAADVFGSIDTVGFYDGFVAPFPSVFNTAQLGPDGKIYLSCGSTDTIYHVINKPDLKGDSCNFVQHGIQLPSLCDGVPSFPNYRLGALSASECDSLSALGIDERAAKEKILKIFPNPASDYVVVDYGFTDWNKGQVSLEIDNALGQIVYTQQLPMYSGYQKLDVSKFASGVYQVAIKRQGAVVAVGKFVKE